MIRLLFYAGLVAAALGGFLSFIHYERGVGAAKERAVWVELQQEQTRLLNAENMRIANAQSEITEVLRTRMNNAKASADAANRAADSLRDRYTKLVSSACTPASAASSSETTTNTTGVLTGLLDRLTAIARRYAQIADERGSSGKAAEELYDSLVK